MLACDGMFILYYTGLVRKGCLLMNDIRSISSKVFLEVDWARTLTSPLIINPASYLS